MTSATPHGHWSHYDEGLEMAQMNAMHAKLVAGDLDVRAQAEELGKMASSCGYGEADSFLADHDPDDRSDYAAAQKEVYDDYEEGDYWSCMDRSENLLSDALVRGPALDAAKRAIQGMRDGFKAGRADREALAPAVAPAP